MAKAESGLRMRIKKALEADGWSVITQHGSAYNPNVLDLTVVLACLEVKTDDGKPTPGQRNTIRKLRKQGIPAGIVRSVEEARQGMAIVKQGAYRVADEPELDLNYLNSLLAGNSAVATAPDPVPPAVISEAENRGLIPAAEPEAPQTLNDLLGMQGTFETFEPTPAPDPEPEPAPAARPLVDAYQSVLKPLSENEQAQHSQRVDAAVEPAPTPEQGDAVASVTERARLVSQIVASQARPYGGLGALERIEAHLAHIDDVLSSFVIGFGGQPAPTPEEPVVRRRRGRPVKAADETTEAVE